MLHTKISHFLLISNIIVAQFDNWQNKVMSEPQNLNSNNRLSPTETKWLKPQIVRYHNLTFLRPNFATVAVFKNSISSWITEFPSYVSDYAKYFSGLWTADAIGIRRTQQIGKKIRTLATSDWTHSFETSSDPRENPWAIQDHTVSISFSAVIDSHNSNNLTAFGPARTNLEIF